MICKLRKNILMPFIAPTALIAAISCSGTNDQAQNAQRSSPRPNSNAAAANAAPPGATSGNNSLGQTVSDAPLTPGFSTDDVCTLPQEVVKNSPFASLGGGTWEKWDEAGGELSFSCTGGKDSVKLEDVIAKISAGYSALGSENAVRAVSATYVALQYGGEVPVEDQLRQKYVDLCDGLSRKFFGQPLPNNLRKRLADESTFSTSGAASEIKEKVGNGMISLRNRKEKTDLIRLEVNFFPDEAAYTKFNES